MKLLFVFYITGRALVQVTNQCPREITIRSNDWWWSPGGKAKLQGPFRIGQDVREPKDGENREFFGPMMVIDQDNPGHWESFSRAIGEVGVDPVQALGGCQESVM